jgi:rhamnosyltransferase
LEALRPHAAQVVVVDNSGQGSPEQAFLEKICTENGYHLIRNKENLGVAAALNQGIGWALTQGFEWMLTMDQDTVALPPLLQTLRDALRDCPFADRVGIVGSPVNNRGYPKRLAASLTIGDAYHEVKTVITSGSLVRLSTFKEIGPFRDELFIDCVDCEFCLRMRQRGYHVIEANEFGMEHAIGTPSQHRFLWKRPNASNHSPLRRYYIARNRLSMCMEYFWRETRWSGFVMKAQIKEMIFVLLYEAEKWAKLRATALGFWHALIGRSGRLSDKRWLQRST